MKVHFANELERLAANDSRVVLVTGDLGFGAFEGFQERFPKQYLNVGVAEQNMIGVSTGLALSGFIVFAYSIGNFSTLRCLEQIRNDAAYHRANVKVVAMGGGFSYGPLGMSHHATEDIAVMRAIPEVLTLAPGSTRNVGECMTILASHQGTGYLRLDKSFADLRHDSVPFRFGTWPVLREGPRATLVSVGGILAEVLDAADTLASEGIFCRVVNAVQLSQIQPESIRDSLGDAKHIFTVEEHVRTGGLFGLVSESIARLRMSREVVALSIGDEFETSVGSQSYLRTQHELSAHQIAETVRSIVSHT